MILKTFTFFEMVTASLVYLLGSHFGSVTVVKPTCSRASNAETYIVCKGTAPIRVILKC